MYDDCSKQADHKMMATTKVRLRDREGVEDGCTIALCCVTYVSTQFVLRERYTGGAAVRFTLRLPRLPRCQCLCLAQTARCGAASCCHCQVLCCLIGSRPVLSLLSALLLSTAAVSTIFCHHSLRCSLCLHR